MFKTVIEKLQADGKDITIIKNKDQNKATMTYANVKK